MLLTVLAWIVAASGAIAVVWFVVELGRRRTRSVEPGLHEEVELPHAAEWELWHNAFSLCSKKVRVCLAELGLEYVGHHVDLVETGRYGNLDPQFLRVNPAATVPVLVHRGHPIYESHEQIRYAARFASPEGRMVPDDPAERAVMERWVELGSLVGDDPMADLERSAGNCVPGLTLPLFAAMNRAISWRRFVVGLLFHRLRMRPLGMMLMKARGPVGVFDVPRLRKAMQRSHRAVATHLDVLEAELERSGGPWILGDTFSLADVGMMVVLDRLHEGGWLDALVETRPRVTAYWTALQSRDSYQTAVLGHRHETVERGRDQIRLARSEDARFAAALEGQFPV